MNFDAFNLNEKVLEAISYMGYNEASPIQEQTIPAIMEGHDMIACAQTGTGKTAAYLLPILNKLAVNEPEGLNTLIIVPVRELAKQIDQQIQAFSYFLPINSISIYGGGDGMDWEYEKKSLMGDANIVVGTPGRLISHINLGYVDFSKIEHLVLDEADKMLDMGFFFDIQKIVSFLPKHRQTLMFSATMPPKIRSLAKHIMNKPKEVTIGLSTPAEGITQTVYYVFEHQKSKLLNMIIQDRPNYDSILIFTSTKSKVNSIARAIKAVEKSIDAISSDLEQEARELTLQKFTSRQTRILVATDVLSRGIDIKDINLIINYDAPHEAESYVHRIGRTARASTKGEAITLVGEHDIRKFKAIERLISSTINTAKLPESLGEGPDPLAPIAPFKRSPQKRFNNNRNNLKK
ncbi:MAG: DEAD/DEAH box helicase [Bacteroidota bacterium]